MARTYAPRHALWRLFAALTAFVLCSADVVQAFHLLLERHVVCAAHGELVDARDGKPQNAAPGGNGAPSAHAPDEEPAEAHDHCALCTGASQTAAVALVAPSWRLAEPIWAAPPVRAIPALPPGRPTLSFAPKHGPPA